MKNSEYINVLNTYLDLPKGAKWLLKGVNSTSLRVLLAPLGRCWYMIFYDILSADWLSFTSIFPAAAATTPCPPSPWGKDQPSAVGGFADSHDTSWVNMERFHIKWCLQICTWNNSSAIDYIYIYVISWKLNCTNLWINHIGNISTCWSTIALSMFLIPNEFPRVAVLFYKCEQKHKFIKVCLKRWPQKI